MVVCNRAPPGCRRKPFALSTNLMTPRWPRKGVESGATALPFLPAIFRGDRVGDGIMAAPPRGRWDALDLLPFVLPS